MVFQTVCINKLQALIQSQEQPVTLKRFVPFALCQHIDIGGLQRVKHREVWMFAPGNQLLSEEHLTPASVQPKTTIQIYYTHPLGAKQASGNFLLESLPTILSLIIRQH